MSPPADITVKAYLVCYRAGYIGYILMLFGLAAGANLWAGYAYMATHHGELLFVTGLMSGLVTAGVQYMLATLLKPQLPDPFGVPGEDICGGDYHGLLPSLSVCLLYHFWVMCWTHELYLGLPRPSVMAVVRRLILLVGIPALVIWSFSSTWTNMAYGIALGMAGGMVTSSLIHLVLLPRMPEVSWVTRWCNAAYQPDLLRDYARQGEAGVAKQFL